MNIRLIATRGLQRGEVIPVQTSPFVIGRAPDCHLQPNSPHVSRWHAALLTHGNRVVVRDLGSRNGTFLNGERVLGTRPVGDRDRLQLGPLEFLVRVQPLPPASKRRGGLARAWAAAVRARKDAKPEERISDVLHGLDAPLPPSDLTPLPRRPEHFPELLEASNHSLPFQGTSGDTYRRAGPLLQRFLRGRWG